MNNIYISLYDKQNRYDIQRLLNSKVDYYKYNIFKYDYNCDIFNNKFVNNMSLKLDIDYILNNVLHDKKISISKIKLKNTLRKELIYLSDLNVIFDKTFDSMDETYKDMIREYIFDILKFNDNIELNEIESDNNMYNNDSKHIETYINESNINKNKLKILLIFNDIADYNEDKVREYISNYKFVDILKMPNINKHDCKKISENIEKINKEYGSTIEIIGKRNIQEYNIYIMYSKVDEQYFYSHYILRKRFKYIDMNNEEKDTYDENIIEYEKNKSFISTLTERLNIDIESYNKNKIGKIMLNKK